ncbi:MAG: DUF615 domain-containing protein [Rhodocyclaceae bacterium]|nr:DUF615 domain-containing protein [Rhodocyclaceae bacterium]
MGGEEGRKAIILPVEAVDKPSKSARKRAMSALQVLGEELVMLSAEQLGKLALPEELYEAVRAAQRFSQHEAHRRQLQYIGKLMRSVDAEPIRAALDEIVAAHPAADGQRLRQLRRNALKERELGKPPRAFRELFRVLRELP